MNDENAQRVRELPRGRKRAQERDTLSDVWMCQGCGLVTQAHMSECHDCGHMLVARELVPRGGGLVVRYAREFVKTQGDIGEAHTKLGQLSRAVDRMRRREAIELIGDINAAHVAHLVHEHSANKGAPAETVARSTGDGSRSLRALQTEGAWGAHTYTDAFNADSRHHRDAAHAVQHITKATGKLAGFLDCLDHDEPFERLAVEKALADVVICTMRTANRWPGGIIDLTSAIDDRLAAKGIGPRHDERIPAPKPAPTETGKAAARVASNGELLAFPDRAFALEELTHERAVSTAQAVADATNDLIHVELAELRERAEKAEHALFRLQLTHHETCAAGLERERALIAVARQLVFKIDRVRALCSERTTLDDETRAQLLAALNDVAK